MPFAKTKMSSNQNSIRESVSTEWEIVNFSTIGYTYNGYFSPCSNSQIQFNLGLFAKSPLRWFEEDVLICLFCNKKDRPKLPVYFKVSILDAYQQKCCTKEFDFVFTDTREQFLAKFISHKDLLNSENKFLTNDKLKLLCEIKVLENETQIVSKSAILGIAKDKICTNIQEDFKSLLESGDLSDVKLVVGSDESENEEKRKEFSAHKSILSARSKVFAAMFAHKDTKEAQEGRVEIPDVKIEAFEALLMYIYTGEMNSLDQHALELFKAADKYQLDNLKLECEQYLGSNLSTESLANTLLIADMHQASELKSKCIEYFVKHGNEVMQTDGWAKIATKPELLVELVQILLKSNK